MRFVSSQNQAYRIAFQETGVPVVHVETEALALIKLLVIGAIAELVTLDQHVQQQVSEILN